MKKIVIGLSGGMDSTTLLAILLEQGYEVHCCIFNYGSKHNKYENAAAENVVNFYRKKGFEIATYFFNLEEIFKPFESNLLKSGGQIPEGHYEHASMKTTVVPGRNLIFASIMSGLAESIQADAVALGVHSGDHAIYPDCRPDFIQALYRVVLLSSDRTIEVLSPLLKDTKKTILKKGIILSVPYELTRTCYKDQQYSCGKCGSCSERLEAFAKVGIEDTIIYE